MFQIQKVHPKVPRVFLTQKELLHFTYMHSLANADIIGDAYAYDFTHDELESQEEVDTVGRFLQVLQEYGEIWSDFEVGNRVQATFSMQQELKDLHTSGFVAYGRQLRGKISGGARPPSDWPIAKVHVFRIDNPVLTENNVANNKSNAGG